MGREGTGRTHARVYLLVDLRRRYRGRRRRRRSRRSRRRRSFSSTSTSGKRRLPICRKFAQKSKLTRFGNYRTQPSDRSHLPPCRLYANSIGPEGAKALAPALLANASLTKVDVRKNGLGEEGKAALQKAVVGRLGFELEL